MQSQALTEAPAKIRLIAACLLNLGQTQEAQAMIFALGPEAGRDPFPQLLQGIVWAQEGQIDKAVQAFLAFLQDHPQETSVRQSALALLHRQAVEKINARDWVAAEATMDHLAALDSLYPGLKTLQEVMEGALPTMALKGNRREEAARVWEEQQRKTPGNGRVAHSLALLYYFAALPRNGDNPGQAPVGYLWQRAIANWAMVSYNQDFWSEWRRQREKVYRITDADLVTLKQNWSKELARTFRQHKTQMEAQERLDLRDQYLKLECLEWLEWVTAAAILDLQMINCPHCQRPTVPVPGHSGTWECRHPGCHRPVPDWQPPHSLPACGPLMLQHLGLKHEANELAQAAPRLPRGELLSGDLQSLNLPFLKTNAEVLEHCLPPWNLGIAYLAHRNFGWARSVFMKAYHGGMPPDILLLYTYLEWGKQLESQLSPLPAEPDGGKVREYLAPIQEALDLWRLGWEYREADAALASQLEERIENLSVRAGNELKQASNPFANKKQWSKEIDLLTQGIEILKSASQIISRRRIMDTMARLYAERGLSHLQIEKLDQSIKDYEEALRINPADANIKTRAAAAYNSRGCKPNVHTALQDFDRAIDLDGTRALYYRNRGIKYANMGQKLQAIPDLKRACEMEPGNQEYRQELMQLFK